MRVKKPKPIDLQKFCRTKHDEKTTGDLFRLPFIIGKYVYATNGHIAIRVRLSLARGTFELAVPDNASKASPSLFPRPFPKSGGKPFEITRTVPQRKHCFNKSVKCKDCHGTGEYVSHSVCLIGEVAILEKFAKLIAALPGPVVYYPPAELRPLVISFDGGHALVCQTQWHEAGVIQ